MLGDTAVAVHPGRRALQATSSASTSILPLVGRRIPIVADEYSRSRERHRRGQGHARRTTSTTSRSASATTCRRSTSSIRSALRSTAMTTSDGRRAEPTVLRSTASTASRRASASSRCWRSAGCSRRSSRTPTRCRTATARASSIEPSSPTSGTSTSKPLAEPAIAAVRGRRAPASCPENWEKTYFDWMREHPALVHLAPALVGPPDPGLVRPGRRGLRRAETRGRAPHRPPARRRSYGAPTCALPPRRGRARHLVLLGALAVLDARLAGRDAGAASATTRPTCWSPASTSSSSGSPG